MQSPIIAFVTWGSDDTYTHAFNSGEAFQVKELYDKKPQDIVPAAFRMHSKTSNIIYFIF